jgi:choline dehydrogenase
VLIDGNKATGVEIIQDGKTQQIMSNQEVILCAGAFASPKFLMLSGIGSENTLNQFGIDTIQNLEGVGQNLQDHLLFGVGFKSKVAFDVPNLLSEAGLFTYTKELEEGKSPNLQFFFGPIQFVDPQYRIDAPAFTFAPILAQPVSRGYVGLKSSNPLDNSLVQPNYLSAPEDAEVLVHGIELARKMAHTKAMEEFLDYEIAPGANLTSKEELINYVRNSASTVWHPVGTCKMGNDEMSVVDQKLKVNGITGLRVADASVMPTITSGNTNAATIMIGEKAAAIILNKV